jgi:3-oxoacyl-[acyl-carrier-protein] synthase-3
MTAAIRPSSGAPYARMLGIGAYRPSRVVTNAEICERLDSSDEWIRTRSGIASRRWAGPGESLQEMSAIAGGKALAQSGISPDQVGCLIIATSTHAEQTPPLAPRVAHQLGSTGVAFDISAGCAGFCCVLSMASDMIRAGSTEYALVIGAERLSVFTSPTDRGTAFLFADGAGAAVVGPSDTPGIGPVVWGSDGSHWELIRHSHPWDTLYNGETTPADHYVQVQGQEVFRWAAYRMVPVARQALEKAGVSVDDLDAFIPHQANLRITEAMTRALKLPEHIPVARDIVESGNTSAASVPLAIEAMLTAGEAPSGGTALLVGFGAGLVYAAQVVTLPSALTSSDLPRPRKAQAGSDADGADTPARSPAGP